MNVTGLLRYKREGEYGNVYDKVDGAFGEYAYE